MNEIVKKIIKKITPEGKSQKGIDEAREERELNRPQRKMTVKEDEKILIDNVIWLPDTQWAFEEYDKKGIRNKIIFPTRNPITPMKDGDQYTAVTGQGGEITEVMDIWTNWSDPKNEKLEIVVRKNLWGYIGDTHGEQENNNPKINEIIAAAEMVADSAKKHVEELKAMYAKGIGKNVDNKQPPQAKKPAAHSRKDLYA